MTARRKLIATADHCSFLYGPPPTGVGSEILRREYEDDWAEINERDEDADAAIAQAAMEWICSVDARDNDYLLNLKALVLKPVWTRKDLGLGASIVSSYLREQGKMAERAARDAADAERKATAEPAPAGKTTVTGVVTSTGTKVNDFGVRDVWTVQDDRGFRVWGTTPKALVDQGVKAGNRVTFTITLEPKSEDPTFAFTSGRASKPAIIPNPEQVASCQHVVWDAHSSIVSAKEEDGTYTIGNKITCSECHTPVPANLVQGVVEAAGMVLVKRYNSLAVDTLEALTARADGDEEVVARMLY